MRSLQRVFLMMVWVSVLGLLGCGEGTSPEDSKSESSSYRDDSVQETVVGEADELAKRFLDSDAEVPESEDIAETSDTETEGPDDIIPEEDLSEEIAETEVTEEQAEEITGPLSEQDLMNRIRTFALEEDLDGAMGFLRKVSDHDPENRFASFLIVVVGVQQAFILIAEGEKAEQDGVQGAVVKAKVAAGPIFLASASQLRELREKYSELDEREKQFAPNVFYNEACSYALGGDSEKSIASLNEAIGYGFTNLEMLKDDEDLVSIRETDGYKKIMEELPARLVAEAKELSRQLFTAHEAFDFDFSLPDVNDEIVSLADYSGKVLIVDFCGTSYPPCRKAIPHFVSLLEKYKDMGLDIVGIHYENMEAEAAKEQINSFAAEFGITYKCLIGDEDTRSRVPEFGGYPTTLFLDRSGVVRLKVVGVQPIEQLEAFVETLLEEPAEGTEKASATEVP